MNIKNNYKHTVAAGSIGLIVQAIVNNFVPLLFVTFQKDWSISLSQLAMMSTYNFIIQLITDLLSAKYADKIGLRRCMIFAHIFAASGLVGLGILPYIMSSPYMGIMISITIYAVGGGLIEVLASPIIEACPSTNKEANMSFLHSFYCWGQVLTIIISTLFFMLFDTANWRIMSFIWAILPAFNAVYFSIVPIAMNENMQTNENLKTKDTNISYLRNMLFWILMVMMLCAGASELAVSQWASAFAEESLGLTKSAGDILGPCFFALLMGIARFSYSKFSNKIPLKKYILFCSALCLIGYLMVSLSPLPIISLLGCGICGFSVGIMWPGTYSIGAKIQKNPPTSMFALFALAGDCGCSAGPFIVGTISELLGDDLHKGLLMGTVFPAIMILAVMFLIKREKRVERQISNPHN